MVEMSTEDALIKNFLSAYYKGRSCDLSPKIKPCMCQYKGELR